ncbi:MAG: DnaJ C-terminal domain-containing protein [Rhodospirillales bacterium]
MRARSLYDILGVPPGASAAEIKTAFRKHARDHHPDTGRGGDSEERFKEISRAYAILGNERERSRYDRGDIDESGASTAAPGGGRYSRKKSGWSGWTSGGKQESDRRGSARHESGGPRKPIKIVGADVTYKLKIDPRSASVGAKRTIATTNGKHLNISIPAGTRAGQVLRLKGQGMPGLNGGRDGDALIEIRIEDTGPFRIDGDNIHLDLPISLKEAVQGGNVEAPGLEGTVRLSVPAGSNSGDVLRLKGKGMEKSDGERGDQFVRLMITLPAKPDSALNAFVRDWSPQSPFTGRDRLKKTPED